jgi:hypothetical protein
LGSGQAAPGRIVASRLRALRRSLTMTAHDLGYVA